MIKYFALVLGLFLFVNWMQFHRDDEPNKRTCIEWSFWKSDILHTSVAKCVKWEAVYQTKEPTP